MLAPTSAWLPLAVELAYPAAHAPWKVVWSWVGMHVELDPHACDI